MEKEAGGSEEKALRSLPEALVWVKSQNGKGHVGAREGKACGEVFGSLLESHNLCRSTTKCLMVSLGSPPVSGVSIRKKRRCRAVESKEELGPAHHSGHLSIIPVPVFNQVKTSRE